MSPNFINLYTKTRDMLLLLFILQIVHVTWYIDRIITRSIQFVEHPPELRAVTYEHQIHTIIQEFSVYRWWKSKRKKKYIQRLLNTQTAYTDNKYVNSKICSHPPNPKCNIGDNILLNDYEHNESKIVVYFLWQRLNWSSLFTFFFFVRKTWPVYLFAKLRKLLATLTLWPWVRDYSLWIYDAWHVWYGRMNSFWL